MADLIEGLTFDDVLLVPNHSDVMPGDVGLQSRFSANVPLNVPISSSAMDTVTEWRLAVALAQEGGIGVIHRNLTIERQREEVEKVKRSANGVIEDPAAILATLGALTALGCNLTRRALEGAGLP